MAELVAAVAAFRKADPGLVAYEPDARLEAAFAAQPPLATPLAEAAGFAHDGDEQKLVARAYEALAPG
jgi:hypothetical protein